MHLGLAASLLSVIPLFVTTCIGLPVHEQRAAQSQALAPRATYSVVPIDGGTGPGGSGGGSTGGSGGSGSGSGSGSGPGSAATVTVTVVETVPAKTSIQTIFVTSPPTTERVTDTVVVTKTVDIVNISAATTTTTTPTTSLISTAQSSRTTPPSAPSPSGSVTTSFTSIAIPLQTGVSSTTTTYDDGKWHTSYPAWNGTLPRRGSRNWPRPRLAV